MYAWCPSQHVTINHNKSAPVTTIQPMCTGFSDFSTYCGSICIGASPFEGSDHVDRLFATNCSASFPSDRIAPQQNPSLTGQFLVITTLPFQAVARSARTGGRLIVTTTRAILLSSAVSKKSSSPRLPYTKLRQPEILDYGFLRPAMPLVTRASTNLGRVPRS
jgi:hypothetical protein